jgi:hypothetical protein
LISAPTQGLQTIQNQIVEERSAGFVLFEPLDRSPVGHLEDKCIVHGQSSSDLWFAMRSLGLFRGLMALETGRFVRVSACGDEVTYGQHDQDCAAGGF